MEVLDVEPRTRHLLLKLADGYNTVLITTDVTSHPSTPHHSLVTQNVECFTCAGGALLPSERLARMFEKQDSKLARLQAYLQPCLAPNTDICSMGPSSGRVVTV